MGFIWRILTLTFRQNTFERKHILILTVSLHACKTNKMFLVCFFGMFTNNACAKCLCFSTDDAGFFSGRVPYNTLSSFSLFLFVVTNTRTSTRTSTWTGIGKCFSFASHVCHLADFEDEGKKVFFLNT